ncbi:MAG: nucleotidyltransferase family protein [Oscillospiraceae bacterium]|jgi:predicted nucleotidyltransferase|nr:nucleotidyltransferase family protein [Oscillospiraceae bacterium]
MQIAGIVAEYNPFHYGHAHHVAATRRAGASHIVCVMSGSFVQRGEAAVLNKWARARTAIACGADLVMELPLTWSLSPAHRFADGAVFLLDALGCADTISFGSECGDIAQIGKAAHGLASNEAQAALHAYIKQGKSYAAAAEEALRTVAPDCAGVLTSANDTLGVEYLSALTRLGSNMQPLAIPRVTINSAVPRVARAEILREAMRAGENIAPLLPEESAAVLREEIAAERVLYSVRTTEKLLLARLCTMRTEEFALLPEVREGLENRLYRAARGAQTLGEFLDSAKTRRFTRASLRRIAMDALLGIRAEDWHERPPYLHVLAMGKGAPEILRAARKTARLPIIHTAAQIQKLDAAAQNTFALERRAEELRKLACESF